MLTNSVQKKVKELFKARALKKGDFVLASGQRSDHYLDTKRITLHGPSLKILAELFWAKLKELNLQPQAVAGVSVGGDPIVAAVILEALHEGVELDALLVRKEPKEHGGSAGRAVDGDEQLSVRKAPVWLLEDVISTGASAKKAAQYLINEGYALRGIMAAVDRKMGGVESLTQSLGLPVLTLLSVDEILV